MASYDVAFVGTGADPEDPDSSGFAMAYHHAEAYERLENCELVACADVVPENAQAFAESFGIDDGGVYEDHETMLAEAEPDVVSVCVPPAIHGSTTTRCTRWSKPVTFSPNPRTRSRGRLRPVRSSRLARSRAADVVN